MKNQILLIFALLIFGISKAQNCQSFYADYSYANYDSNWALSTMNTSIIGAQDPNYWIKELAVVFTSNPIGGYSPDEIGSLPYIYYNVSYIIDTIYFGITHENNSGENNSIIVYACELDNLGRPDTNNIIWSDTTVTNISLSPGGNYIGPGSGYSFRKPVPNIAVTNDNDVAFGIKYIGNSVDTFGILGGFTGAQSMYRNSYVRAEPDYLNWTKNSDITFTNNNNPNPEFMTPQNWNIVAHTCIDFSGNSGISSEICKVTIDSINQKWKVIWQKSASPYVESYVLEIFTENDYNVYIQNANDFSTWIDPTPVVEKMSYSLSSLDTNGIEFLSSSYHTPIFVTIADSSTYARVSYNQYYGYSNNSFLTYDYIYLYRGTSPLNMAIYDSIPYQNDNLETYTYLDPEPNSYGNYYYQMEAVFNTSCEPSMPVDGNNGIAEKGITKSTSRSNIVRLSTVGLAEEQALLNNIKLFPNPAQNTVTINLSKAATSNVTVSLYNTLGQLVNRSAFDKNIGKNLTVDISQLTPGVYIAQVEAFGGTKTLRLVKN